MQSSKLPALKCPFLSPQERESSACWNCETPQSLWTTVSCQGQKNGAQATLGRWHFTNACASIVNNPPATETSFWHSHLDWHHLTTLFIFHHWHPFHQCQPQPQGVLWHLFQTNCLKLHKFHMPHFCVHLLSLRVWVNFTVKAPVWQMKTEQSISTIPIAAQTFLLQYLPVTQTIPCPFPHTQTGFQFSPQKC